MLQSNIQCFCESKYRACDAKIKSSCAMVLLQISADDACDKPIIIMAIACCLSSPYLPSRKIAVDILLFMLHWKAPIGYQAVLQSFSTYQSMLGGGDPGAGRYTTWLKVLSETLDGRGRMGSLVGASKEMKKGMLSEQLTEPLLAEYAVSVVADKELLLELTTCLLVEQLSNLWLINSLLKTRSKLGDPEFPRLDTRTHVRLELERCGVKKILGKLPAFKNEKIDGELENYRQVEEDDRRELLKTYDRRVLKDLQNPKDVVNGIMNSIEGTKAEEFFMSSLRHLMLIKDDGDQRVRYYQLIDQLVTSVVLDQQPGVERDFSSVMDISVQRVFGRFEESERLEQAQEQVKDLESRNIKLQREKESLVTELAEVDGGLVGRLKLQVLTLEEKLATSRRNTETVGSQMEEMRLAYEDKIEQLEAEIRELYNMLRETRELDTVLETGGQGQKAQNRRSLIANLDQQMKRRQTIRKLMGQNGEDSGSGIDGIPEESEGGSSLGDDTGEDGEILVADKLALNGAKGLRKSLTSRQKKTSSGSQFMDAEDERVRAHIEARLTGEDEVSVATVIRHPYQF